MIKIDIANDYTRYPGGRYSSDGAGNGEDFRKKFLVPVLSENKKAIIFLDGTAGYPSSFLEEAFGGLVRVEGFLADKVLETFEFYTEVDFNNRYRKKIEKFVKNAIPANFDT